MSSTTNSLMILKPVPKWLRSALVDLLKRYPHDDYVPTMYPAANLQIEQPAGLLHGVTISSNSGCLYVPRIICLDCPGKFYLSGPGTTVKDFETHVRNQWHRGNVNHRRNKYAPSLNPANVQKWNRSRNAIFTTNQSSSHSASRSSPITPRAEEASYLELTQHLLEDGCNLTDSGYASAFNIMRGPNMSLERIHADKTKGEPTCDIDDAQTGYSTATTSSQIDSQRYVSELSNTIHKNLQQILPTTAWASLRNRLPELIKAFALRIGAESPARLNCEIMYFTHKYHR